MHQRSTKLIWITSLVAYAIAFGQDPQRAEFDAIRARYKDAQAEAASSLRKQYIKDLEALKGRAMKVNNLNAVDDVDRALKAAEEPAAPRTPVEVSGYKRDDAIVKATLASALWTLESVGKKPATIRFDSDGTFKSEFFQGTYSVTFRPTVATLQYVGATAALTFNAAMDSFTGEQRSGLSITRVKGHRRE